MKKINGNIIAYLQRSVTMENEIGEAVRQWETVKTIKGYLDMKSEGTDTGSFNVRAEQSTHIFICQYPGNGFNADIENKRLLINSEVYEILMIDDPLGVSEHYEIYLRYKGGV